MRTAVAFVVALATAATATAQTVAVLNIKSTQQTPNGVVYTLASGATITVPYADVDVRLSSTVNGMLANGLLKDGALASTPPPSQPSAPPNQPRGQIQGHCAKQWPDNFQMRVFCEEQQTDALAKLTARQMGVGDLATIRATCEKQWGENYQMRNFCEEQQLEALRKLRSR